MMTLYTKAKKNQILQTGSKKNLNNNTHVIKTLSLINTSIHVANDKSITCFGVTGN